jgi:hypothetical protein
MDKFPNITYSDNNDPANWIFMNENIRMYKPKMVGQIAYEKDSCFHGIFIGVNPLGQGVKSSLIGIMHSHLNVLLRRLLDTKISSHFRLGCLLDSIFMQNI